MSYLVCKKCKGYYELMPGESPGDFEECECGGNLTHVQSLDIPYNKERVKTIIETFKNEPKPSKNPNTRYNKLSITVDYTDGLNRLLNGDKSLPKKETPVKIQRNAYKEVASVLELYKFDYIDSIDDDTALKVTEILANVVNEGKGVIDATNKITSETSLTYDDAMHISKNEISRIKNLGNWYIHKEKGYKYFKISKAFDACEICHKTYDNMIFTMEQLEMLPPLHDLCKCNAMFYKDTK